MVQQKLDPKWLEGLKFHYAEKKMIEKNGRKTLQAIPMERPLKEEDIPIITHGPRKGERNWTDYGDKVVIVTNNGKKYTVEKSPKPKETKIKD
jgi:Tat protein secretion system quality control protein TatD with DNase activity